MRGTNEDSITCVAPGQYHMRTSTFVMRFLGAGQLMKEIFIRTGTAAHHRHGSMPRAAVNTTMQDVRVEIQEQAGG